jgi:hypothetical protein
MTCAFGGELVDLMLVLKLSKSQMQRFDWLG